MSVASPITEPRRPAGLSRSGASAPDRLAVSIGQHSEKGRKPANQDFYGALIPDGEALSLKGIAVVIADGISSSPVGAVAAESAVKTFLTDYSCTPDSWSVKSAGLEVIVALNSWLYAQTRRAERGADPDRGYLTTFSALVLKGRAAHLFHVGDSRIHRVAGRSLERLTEDHRVRISADETYLGRALGLSGHVEIDYRRVPAEAGDVFVLTTDGVHDHMADDALLDAIGACGDDLDGAARRVARLALESGSTDNLTIQIVRVDALPPAEPGELVRQVLELPPAAIPEPGQTIDGFRILRRLHGSSRSHVFLAADLESGRTVALKVPSQDMRDDAEYLRRLMMEEWVARRLSSAHVLKAAFPERRRSALYVVTEHVEGQTLRQWMHDHPRPELGTVRDIVGQIVAGLRSFHRREMIHQDLRPENVMIDRDGTVKIIDLGSVAIAGVIEAYPVLERPEIAGTHQYSAPEYFLGLAGTPASDQFALGVIAYEMLTGELPYGAAVPRVRTRRAQAALRYRSAGREAHPVPEWVDRALERAVHPDPMRRYEALSEFVEDLRRPNSVFTGRRTKPLVERHPVLFWKAVSAVLAILLVGVLAAQRLRSAPDPSRPTLTHHDTNKEQTR